MKLTYIVVFTILLGVGGFVLGARSTRPDFTLSAVEELSLLRAETSAQSAKNAAANEKDPVKAKALTAALEARAKGNLSTVEGIRKSHRCEACVFRWYLETDGSIKMEPPTATPLAK